MGNVLNRLFTPVVMSTVLFLLAIFLENVIKREIKDDEISIRTSLQGV